MKKLLGIWIAAIAVVYSAGGAQAASIYSNDFSTNTAGWLLSGTGATVTRDTGLNTATVIGSTTGSIYTNFGGYNFGVGNAVPTVFQEYYTSLDIYLDLAGGWANDTRFDWSSAINNNLGTHRRDFIFNAGFYNDATGPGANTNRFVISASNNSQPGNAYAKNPDRDPIAISTPGWYTFEHHFYDNGGVLAVDMSIFDIGNNNSLVHQWTLSDPSDLIAGIGGNRYGWFDYNQFPVGATPLISGGLQIDNARLDTAAVVPVPAAAGLGFLGMGLVGFLRRRKNTAA